MTFPDSRLAWRSAFVLMMVVALLTAFAATPRPAFADAPAGGVANAETAVAWIELSGQLKEGAPPFSIGDTVSDEGTLRGLIRRIDLVAENPRYTGMVVYFDQPVLTPSHINEISLAIARVREAGKPVLAFAEQYDMPSYLLACSADKILLQRHGSMMLVGYAMEEYYLKGLLDKIGVKADMVQVGQYKGAEESFTRTGPSEQWSQTMDALLDDLYSQAITKIGEARGMKKPAVEKAMANVWSMDDEQYLKAGLVDGLTDPDLRDVSTDTFGESFAWDSRVGRRDPGTNVQSPFALLQLLFQGPQRQVSKPTIALITAQGPIMSGESETGGLFGAATVGSRSVVRSLVRAREQPNVKGVVLRLDSPGGSALASEVIWQAVRECAKVKPVYISLGSIAASGGYYIACAGTQVYAGPGTIVGSIGVVGGKITMGELYEKLGVNVHRRSRGPMGDIFNSVEPFTPEQREAIRKAMEQTYELFVQRVEEGRGDRLNAPINEVTQGRVFAGEKAKELGLVDRIGGLETTLAELANAVGLAPDTYEVLQLPEPMTLPEFLERTFSGGGLVVGPLATPEHATIVQQVKLLLGPHAWPAVRDNAAGMLLLRQEPVLTLTPAAIVIK